MAPHVQRAPLVAGLVALTLALAACGTTGAAVPYVDLSHREPVPVAIGYEGTEPLRVAIAAVLSPEGNVDSYTGLAQYLGEHVGRPVELVQRRTYAEVNALIADGSIDVAFICTSAYVVGAADHEMDLLVVPEVDGGTVYHSVVIVHADSDARTFNDLADSAFAFTDPMSLTGRVYPTHLVQEVGSTPDAFFGSTFYTYSHDRAIEAVADGIADGAAVDSLVLDYALARDHALADRIRVIHTSAPFGIPPVVVPSGSPAGLRADLEHALLDLGSDPIGQAILAQIGVDRFVLGTDSAYDDVRALVAETRVEP